jgi:hypothetical protein
MRSFQGVVLLTKRWIRFNYSKTCLAFVYAFRLVLRRLAACCLADLRSATRRPNDRAEKADVLPDSILRYGRWQILQICATSRLAWFASC